MDPESTPTSSTASNSTFSTVGDFAQLEALLAGRMKALESELAGLRRDLQEARRQEVHACPCIYWCDSANTGPSLLSPF